MASYSYGGSYKRPLILPRPLNSGQPRLGPVSSSSSSSSATGRSQALKVHSLAEKRRRERINDHLSTLRRMVPDANKMDKAALLGKVIDHVKDLKRKASSISNGFSIPTESNEVIVESKEFDATNTITSDTNNFYIKASISCDDRPGLFTSLMKAFHGLRLRTIRADITSLGGRVQNVFLLCGRRENGNGSDVHLSSLKESVEDALARIASFDVVAMDASSSKRQRLLQSYYSSVSI